MGYNGELCSVCADGYFMDNNRCLLCESSFITPTLIIVSVIIFIISVASITMIWYYYFVLVPWELRERSSRRPSSVSPDSSIVSLFAASVAGKNKESIRMPAQYMLYVKAQSFVAENNEKIVAIIKILISTYQIITLASSYTNSSLPISYSRFIQGLNIINFNVGSILPMNCTQSVRYSYIDTLYLITLGPIIVSALIFMAFIVSYYYARRKIQSNNDRKKGDKTKKFNDLRSQYLSYFFYLM